MRIGFIGAGRMGFTMGKYLKDQGVQIAGYFSRNPEHASEAARFTDTICYKNADELIKDCDAVFLTVSDTAIKTVFSEISKLTSLEGKIVCHTSGATSSEVFNDTSLQVYGYSIHPIYAVSDRYESYKHFSNAFITIEGHPEYLDTLRNLFEDAGLKTGSISTDSKTKYHAATAIASNLVCGIYGAASRILTECGFSEDDAAKALNGLFLDNAKGICANGPVAQLTGPLERNDLGTLKGHLSVLNPSDQKLYKEVSKEVLKLAKIKNDGRDYSEIESLLNAKGEEL